MRQLREGRWRGAGGGGGGWGRLVSFVPRVGVTVAAAGVADATHIWCAQFTARNQVGVDCVGSSGPAAP